MIKYISVRIISLIGLDSEIISFEDFRQLIHKDYRDMIIREFASIKLADIYDQTFPLQTPYGEIWVHSQLGEKETDTNGHLIAWEFIQYITDPHEIKTEKALEKFNIHLHQQNNISRSLLAFLKTEDTREVICKILENLLEQFHGSRAYIVEYDWEKQRQNCTFEVNAQGVVPQQERLHDLPTHDTPWWTEEMLLRHPILLLDQGTEGAGIFQKLVRIYAHRIYPDKISIRSKP